MRVPVIIGMATIQARAESLLDTLASIDGQFDELHIYANDYEPEIDMPGVIVHYAPLGDLGDAGMMWPFTREFETTCKTGPIKNAYCLCIPDDLIYRENYVQLMVEGIERYGRRAAVGFHGRQQFGPCESFYHGPLVALRCLGTVPEDTPCTILSTAAAGWHSSLISWSLDDFPQALPDGRPSRNMADVWFSKKLQEFRVPRMILAHQFGFIRHTKLIDATKDTIAAQSKGKDATGNWKDAVQTEVFNSIEWTLDTP